MLIILEGVDGSGKSTLAKGLHDHYGGELLHRGPLRQNPIDEYYNPLRGYDPSVDNVICDRWHVGELIYGPLLRGESQLTPALRWYVEAFLASRGALLVLCDPGVYDVQRVLKRRGDELIKPEQVHEIMESYREELLLGELGYMTLDTFHGPKGLKFVAGNARLVTEKSEPLWKHPTYVGPVNPDVLLLGERRNGTDDPTAFVPRPSTSGLFMLTALQPWASELGTVGLANACEEDIPALLNALTSAPRVVTLGNEAHEAVGSITHGAVPHPQFIRRFHHSAGEWYREQITLAATYREDLRTCRP